jgi:aspartate carbamoyltransferase catalytic subunit
MHILSVEQFDPTYLGELFGRADELKRQASDPVLRRELAERHIGRQMCSLFYEPSTRTRLSFEAAAAKMGVGVVSTENAREFSSAAKGETLEDTIRVLDAYDFGAIVLRHHETGAATRAAAVSKTPIINAGDGKGEHPTQALLDAYTIHREFGRLDNLRVVMGGDLAHGRTVRSLAQLLAKYDGNTIDFVSTPELQIDEDIKIMLRTSNTEFSETSSVADVLSTADVVYWTRTQTERHEGTESAGADNFALNAEVLKPLPDNAIIMHPLPRVTEIATEVDDDPRARYFEQAGNGLYIRMALLDQIFQDD